MLEDLSHINVDSFQDESIRSTLRVLLNLIESRQKKILEQSETIQKLKNEIYILKGEQGKPTFKPKKPPKDISSESHLGKLGKKVKWKKKGKKKELPIDKKEECRMDKSLLPKDAVFKKYETVVQQDIVFERMNTEFRIKVWYSPSENRTYRSRPGGYSGYFGNELRTFALVMHNFADMTQNKLLELLRGMGIEISTGSLQNILSSNKDT